MPAIAQDKKTRQGQPSVKATAPRRGILARVRQIQNNPGWLRRLRAQYTKEVSRRTLELNEKFPLSAE